MAEEEEKLVTICGFFIGKMVDAGINEIRLVNF